MIGAGIASDEKAIKKLIEEWHDRSYRDEEIQSQERYISVSRSFYNDLVAAGIAAPIASYSLPGVELTDEKMNKYYRLWINKKTLEKKTTARFSF